MKRPVLFLTPRGHFIALLSPRRVIPARHQLTSASPSRQNARTIRETHNDLINPRALRNASVGRLKNDNRSSLFSAFP
jgi:hypothetical protein